MNRRMFLKSAVTTCGVVVVGIPGVTLAENPVRTASWTNRGELRFVGAKTRGCTIPGYRGNHHDIFPQDLQSM